MVATVASVFRTLGILESREPSRLYCPLRALFSKKSGCKSLTDHKLFKLSRSAKNMMRLVLRERPFTAVIKALVQYSKILESGYGASLDEAHLTVIWKHLVSCVFLQCAFETTYRRYINMTRLMRLYLGAILLLENFNGEAAASSSAARKGRLRITHFASDLLLHSEKKKVYFSTRLRLLLPATTRMRKTTAALSSAPFSYFYNAARLGELKIVHKRPVQPASRHVGSFF